MKAYELKAVADQINKEKEDPQIEAGYKRISRDLEELARQGKYSYTYSLGYLNVSRKVWQEIAQLLRKDGFSVEFDTQVTHWYSQFDYDKEEIVRISWV